MKTSIDSFTRLRNKAFRMYFGSGKVKLASAALKERYVRWRLETFLQQPERFSRTHVPVRDDIVLSLTSWSERLDVLPVALYCLINQSVWPGTFEVWLTHDDIDALPVKVREAFATAGVKFRPTKDYRSHKKWLPAIRSHPDRFIVTADDDVLYPRHWLEWLLRDFDPARDVSTAHVCKQILFDSAGMPLPYDEWIQKKTIEDGLTSSSFFAIGYGGRILHSKWIPEQFLDMHSIFEIAPKSDDVWLACALWDSGVPTKNTRCYLPFLEVAGTYSSSLQQYNNASGWKDTQLRDTMEAFGIGMGDIISHPCT